MERSPSNNMTSDYFFLAFIHPQLKFKENEAKRVLIEDQNKY